jgi:hypothetical protein
MDSGFVWVVASAREQGGDQLISAEVARPVFVIPSIPICIDALLGRLFLIRAKTRLEIEDDDFLLLATSWFVVDDRENAGRRPLLDQRRHCRKALVFLVFGQSSPGDCSRSSRSPIEMNTRMEGRY